MNRFLKKDKGITLIALVITVILMLILAGVTVTGVRNGKIFDYASKAGKDAEKADYLEALQLAILQAENFSDLQTKIQASELFKDATFMENSENGMLFIKARKQLLIFSN